MYFAIFVIIEKVKEKIVKFIVRYRRREIYENED